MTNPLARDLDHVLAHTAGVWDELRDARVFLTGGTGLFGCWLLESYVHAWERLGLGGSITVLTRSAGAFHMKAPHLASHGSVHLVEGDVRSFRLPGERFSHVIHAAADATPELCRTNPLLVHDTIVDGTRRVLDLATDCGARRFLLTSSGAVYGAQPRDLTHVPESYTGAPDVTDAKWVYGEAKRVAEMLCTIYSGRGLAASIARCFAFFGPYLPLDMHFAIGNFMRDAMRGGPIRIGGDGTPMRSYLYMADLAIWLWTILVAGAAARPYNVGAERAMSIAELAHVVGGESPVEIAGTPVAGRLPDRYVPSTERARTELNLKEWISLEDGLRRTMVKEVAL